MKKTLIIIFVLILLGGGVFALIQSRKNQSPAANSNQTQTAKPFDPRNPGFILGEVVSASASEIKFKAGKFDFTAQIGSSTKLEKQSYNKGVITMSDASISDFKPNASIMVYFDSPATEDGVYSQVSQVKITE